MSSEIVKAVILAAGMGNRISSVNKGLPKPLLPLSGIEGDSSFLDWHIEKLYEAGVNEIYLVGNTKTMNAKLQVPHSVLSKIKLHWILNPTQDLSTSGSAHSLWFADQSDFKIFDGDSRVFLMDADIYYTQNIFKLLLDDRSKKSKTLIAPKIEENSEEVLVFSKNGDIPFIQGKGVFSQLKTQGLQCLGEATGVLLWEKNDHALLSEVTQWCMSYSTAKTRSEHEDVTQRMMFFEKLDSVILPKNYFFMEVDTPEEYTVLINHLNAL